MTSGSLEYIVNGNSDGRPVANLEVADVPMIVGVIWGVTNVTAVDPPREDTLGEWTANGAAGVTATIYYWPETGYDAGDLAQQIVAQQQGGGGGELTQ